MRLVLWLRHPVFWFRHGVLRRPIVLSADEVGIQRFWTGGQ